VANPFGNISEEMHSMFNISDCVMVTLAAIGVFSVAETIWQHFKPKPKPQRWKITFTSPCGYPQRGYLLDEVEVNRLLALIHHEEKVN
jgi:hypothetical protein